MNPACPGLRLLLCEAEDGPRLAVTLSSNHRRAFRLEKEP